MKYYLPIIALFLTMPSLALAYSISPNPACGSDLITPSAMGSDSNYISVFNPDGSWANAIAGPAIGRTITTWRGSSPVDGTYHFLEAGAGSCTNGTFNYATCYGLVPSQFYPDEVYTVSCGGGGATTTPDTSATSTIEQTETNTAWGFAIFLAYMWFIMWIFKKR